MTKATSNYAASLLLTTALLLFMGGSAAAQSGENSRYRQFRDTAAASISNPSSGNVRLFFDSTGFYWKNSAGVTTAVGGGGISGLTAAVIPAVATGGSSLEDSKMTTSGTNGGMWTLYDDTAVTGKSTLVIRNGPGQAINDTLLSFQNNAGSQIGYVAHDTVNSGILVGAMDIRDPGAAYFVLGANNPKGLGLAPTVQVQWGASGPYIGFDVGLVRGGAAGILAVTDGSTGQGGIGIADAATNTVSDALILRHQGGTVAGNGFGTGLVWEGENDGGVMHPMASIDAVYVTDDDTAEDVKLVFSAYANGAEFEIFSIDPYQSTVTGPALLFPSGPARIGTTSGEMQVTAATDLVFGEQGVAFRWRIPETTGHFVPEATNTYDIGTSSLGVKDFYVAGKIKGLGGLILNAGGNINFEREGVGGVFTMLGDRSAMYPVLNQSTDLGQATEQFKSFYVSTSIQGVRNEVIPTDNVAENFVVITSAVENAVTAGYVEYTVTAVDTTNEIIQTETGVVPFVAVNENGTVTSTFGTPYGVHQDNAGGAALAVSFGTSVSTTNVTMTVTSNYDQATLTGTVVNTLRYRVVLTSGTATVTPQT